MLTIHDVLETNQMIQKQNLDVRTITMGISLLDCCSSDGRTLCNNIYDKVTRYGEHLVQTGEDIAREFGVPIINKRVSVTPIALVAGCSDLDNYVEIARTLDKAAKTIGIDFIGGFSALVERGYAAGDKKLIASIPEALACTDLVCSSVAVGSTKAGINMDAVAEMGRVFKKLGELTKDKDALGCAKLVVFSNAVEDNPFMAGAFHGVTQGDSCVSVGVSGPGVVKRALENVKGEPFDVVAETIKKTAFKITRVGQLVAQEASRRLNVPFGIIDLSLAPTPAVALLNDAVKKGGLMASSRVGGLSGAFIPVSEDKGMLEAVGRGSLSLEKLEAMTCVCSVGLDMIAIPGSTTAATISALIADEAAIGMINNKTTAVRVIPVPGKDVGDTVEFGGLLGHCPIIDINKYKSDAFIARGGRIPAPMRSLTN